MTVPLFVGAFVALVVGLFISFVYIPSAVKNTLQLRCGQIETLGSSTFNRQKKANLPYVAQFFGVVVWGVVACFIIFAGLFGGTVFLYLWQVSADKTTG